MSKENKVLSKSKTLKDILEKGPDFINNTPLDNFFKELNDDFLSKIPDTCDDKSLYDYMGYEDNHKFVFKLLSYFDKLYELTTQLQSEIAKKDQNLLPVSLHDVKYMDRLLNLLLFHGITINLPSSELRNLTPISNNLTASMVSPSYQPDELTLREVTSRLLNIIMSSNITNYIRTALLRGPAYPMLYLSQLIISIEQQQEEESIPILYDLESIQDTYTLYVMYTNFIQCLPSSSSPSHNVIAMRKFIMNKLATLPIRRTEDGIITLIDFILGTREDMEVTNLPNKFERIYSVLMSIPQGMRPGKYLSLLFPQLYHCLSLIDRPEVITCVNGLVSRFFMRNKKIVRDFLWKPVGDVLCNLDGRDFDFRQLNDCINVLISLSKNNDVEVVSDLIVFLDWKKFFLNLWIYCLFLKKNEDKVLNVKERENENVPVVPYFEVILSLLKTFFILNDGKFDVLNLLSLNLVNFEHENWKYMIDLENGMPYIANKAESILNELNLNEGTDDENKLNEISNFFNAMDLAVQLYIDLLKLINDDEKTKDIFLTILNRWVKKTTSRHDQSTLSLGEEDDINGNVMVLIDLKLLEKMNQEFKTDIIKQTKDVLTVINDLVDFVQFQDDKLKEEEETVDSDDEDEEDEEETASEQKPVELPHISTAFKTILELFSYTLNNSTKNYLLQYKNILSSIDEKLMKFINNVPECKTLHENVQSVLNDQQFDKMGPEAELVDEELEKDKETLHRVMMDLNDPLVPIKAHGLVELRQLIKKKSKVIDVDRGVQIHLQFMKNQDPFIYMNAIKGFASLIQLETDKTMNVLLEFYRDDKSRNKLDDILKVGEIFINYVQYENKLLGSHYANLLVDVCLDKIKTHNGLDNRIRMSSMSILGIILQVNAIGVQSRVNEMVDCAVGILHLETGEDEAIMRRAAVHLIHDLFSNDGISSNLSAEYGPERLKTLLEYTRTKIRMI
ncbi:Rtp1p NDAI_0I01020 [Naumovozyma dairenensis CBS 421]|uniref:RNA polymerase II assembly factor Rtp1 C-terminal domain-containing protein n=1 Tax=Naumovozyma dairenensis (strain ATCC 10597 / BCRC 20456 / CBS 421 / NBRC 0211 / NRRL Y-12639) TaxID=1071378 RepID=G0WFW0_NAUDC|nr:hypothetical protein NDAI_0I01020 [Naumovozyma dairenensis CBS 421]CCD26671.1 hypothetical protein NDAI_0I01020 [Naumovozyma dairenensis CBS 421]